MSKKKGAWLLAVLFCTVAVFSIGALADEVQPQYGGTLRYGAYDIPGSLDPHHCLHRGLTTQYIAFQHLLKYNQQLDFVPRLAESWDIPDPQTYIFHIRKGVLFHDGSHLTAEVVAFNLERLKSDYSEYQSDFKIVDSVDILDDYTVEVHLSSPCAPFLDLLTSSRGYIVSQKAVLENGNEWFQKHPVGSGPFQFESWDERSGVLKYIRFDNYWEPSKPYLDRVEFVKIPDATARGLAFEAGDIDYIYKPYVADLDRIQDLGGKILPVQAQSNSIDYLMFNTKESPFDDQRVRQAIAYALDIDRIVAFVEHIEPLAGPLPSTNWGHNPDLAYVYDPEKAKELLTEAGYPNGFSVTLTIRSAWPLCEKAALVVQENLAQVGITVSIEVVESATVISQGRAGELLFAILHYGGGGRLDPNGNLSSLFLPGAPYNYTGYDNAEVAELITQAGKIVDRAERQNLYWQAEEIIVAEDIPAIFFGKLLDYVAYRDNFHGVKLLLTGYILDCEDIWMEQ